MKSIRIVHVATNDISGGAARAAYRIHRGLCNLGEESSMFVKHRWSDDPTVCWKTYFEASTSPWLMS
jgi:hypothetical protein